MTNPQQKVFLIAIDIANVAFTEVALCKKYRGDRSGYQKRFHTWNVRIW